MSNILPKSSHAKKKPPLLCSLLLWLFQTGPECALVDGQPAPMFFGTDPDPALIPSRILRRPGRTASCRVNHIRQWPLLIQYFSDGMRGLVTVSVLAKYFIADTLVLVSFVSRDMYSGSLQARCSARSSIPQQTRARYFDPVPVGSTG